MWGSLRSSISACTHRRAIATWAATARRSADAGKTDRGIGNGPAHSSGMSPKSLMFFGVPIAVTFSLGVWQVRRLKRKVRLIEEREKRLAAQPLDATELFESTADLDHRRVEVSGRFLHGLEMVVGPRSAPKDLPTPVLQWGGSSGLQVITPLEMDDGHIILVNRGWIPQRLEDPTKRPGAAVSPYAFLMRIDDSTAMEDYEDGAAVTSSRKTFNAVVRGCDEKNRFTPDNKPEKDEWYYVDPPVMMQAAGLGDADSKAVVIELLKPLPNSGWPHPRRYEEFLEFRIPPSTHVTYATTWFCLSAALALLTRNRFRQPARGRSG